MSDLISRKMVMEYLQEQQANVIIEEHKHGFVSADVCAGMKSAVNAFINYIVQAPSEPTVEAEWVLVSQWKDEEGVLNPIYRCTACHIPNDEEDRFCKHCGAKMKGVA